jgi:DNA-binding NtrC family response regulator
VSRHDVLVFSADPLAAALLGAAVELAGHRPHFPQPREDARSALRRVRPQLALIDCDHEEACAESFIGPALMTGAKVLLFRSRRTARDMGELTRRLALVVVEMPVDHEELSHQLRQAIGR